MRDIGVLRNRAWLFLADDTRPRVSRLLHGRVGTIRPTTGKRVVCASIVIYISHHPRHLGFAHFLTSSAASSDVRAEYARGLHTSTVHIHGCGVQREPAQLRRQSPPVFALAWHGTASLFGHFRPGQAPPTFILITSWFAPGFCSPSFFPSERFPTADAWEPHLCPLAYSCPGPCDAGLDVSLSLSLSLFSLLRLAVDLAEIRRRCALDALDVTVQG